LSHEERLVIGIDKDSLPKLIKFVS